MSGKVVAWLVAGLVVLGVAGGVAWWWVSNSSCTVGVAGTQVTVTVSGSSGAGNACQQLISTTTSGSAYLADSSTPEGSLTCRYQIQGLTYTVRDTGLMLYGGGVCASLKQQYEGAPAPSPSAS